MLCAELVIRKDDVTPEQLRPLPCRSWGCEYCAPMRRRQLMATAAAGEPNKLLTLTVNVTTGHSSGHRRDLLHDAWKKLVKRINRQFALKPEKRWPLLRTARTVEQTARLLHLTSKTAQLEVKTLPYFAFLERTKRGEPHLHILLRSPYIPQDWLSEQMFDLLGSPIVWIEAIKGSEHAIAYVTKYVTKEPAQWGNKKRYWQSRNWKLKPDDDSDDWKSYDGRITVQRLRWRDLVSVRVRERWTIEQGEDGWYTFHRPGQHENWQTFNPDLWRTSESEGVPPSHPPKGVGSKVAVP